MPGAGQGQSTPGHLSPSVWSSPAGKLICGRKQTLSGLIRLVISLECFIEITPDFLCPL